MSALPFLALMRHPLLDNPLVRHTSWDNLQNVFRATLLLDFLFSGSKLGNKELLVPTPTTNNGIDMDPTPTRTVVVTADTKLLAFFCWALCIGFALGFTVCWVLRVTSIHTLDENKYDDVMPANSESLRTVTEETLETKAHVGLYKRFQRLRPLKSQVKIGSTDSPQWQPVTQLITWYLPSPADERSVPTVLSAAAVEGASEDPIEDIIKDNGLGFYISSVDMLRLDAFFHQEYSDYIIAWRFVTVMADSESAILVLRMLFSVEGADAENPPEDIAVLLPLEASNHPDACFKLWLGDHFVGITRPDVAHWSDCFPQWRDMEPSQYQWDWELDSDSHEANATAQSTLCAEVEHDFEDLDNTFGLGMPAMDFKDLDDAFGLGTPMATTMSAAAVVHGTTAAKYDAGLDDNDWNEDAMARFIATLNVPKWATTPIPTVIPVDLVTMAARPTPCTALVRRGRGACQSRTTTPTLTIPEWATTSFTTAMLPVFLVKMMALSTTCTAMVRGGRCSDQSPTPASTLVVPTWSTTPLPMVLPTAVTTRPTTCVALVRRGRGCGIRETSTCRPSLSVPKWAMSSIPMAIPPVVLNTTTHPTTCTALVRSGRSSGQSPTPAPTLIAPKWPTIPISTAMPAMVATHPKACMVLVPRGRGRDTGTTPMLRPTLSVPKWVTSSFPTTIPPVILAKMVARRSACVAMVRSGRSTDQSPTAPTMMVPTTPIPAAVVPVAVIPAAVVPAAVVPAVLSAMVTTHPTTCMVLVRRGRGRDTGKTPMLRPTLSVPKWVTGSIPTTIPPAILVKMMARPTTGMAMVRTGHSADQSPTTAPTLVVPKWPTAPLPTVITPAVTTRPTTCVVLVRRGRGHDTGKIPTLKSTLSVPKWAISTIPMAIPPVVFSTMTARPTAPMTLVRRGTCKCPTTRPGTCTCYRRR